MTDDLVTRLRSSNGPFNWEDAVATYLEAADRIEKLEANIKLQLEWYLSNKRVLADRIEKLEAALRGLINANENGWHPMKMNGAEWFTARKALEGKDD